MPNGDVQFDVGAGQRPQYKRTPPKVIQWVMQYSFGIIKDEKQAQYVLLAFFVLSIGISIFFMTGSSKNVFHKTGPTEPAALKAAREGALR